MRARISAIENLISRDPARRNIFGLVQPGHLRLASLSLLKAERVLIASGFPVLSKKVDETDGPPGALALGEALQRLGIETAYLTDRLSAPLLSAIGAKPLLPFTPDLLDGQRASHLVAVERPGRARDGRYYNMFGRDISHLTEPLDQLFLEAEERGVTTIGIGDGGNEIGMGRVLRGVTRAVDRGRLIASVVPTDYVIVSGVSNWGAYGLVGALSVLKGVDLLPDEAGLTRTMEELIRAGAVDGVEGRPQASVDGLPLWRTVELVEEIRELIKPSPLRRLPGIEAGVLGAGQSGLAAARLLIRSGARVRITDLDRDPPPDLAHCPWEKGRHSLKFLEGIDLAVRSPGLAPDLPVIRGLRSLSVPVVSELELAFELGRPFAAAVTGGVGKLSTVELTAGLMARAGRPASIGGNKGRPCSQLLLEGAAQPLILAVSSFQLETVVGFHPRVAAILNTGPFHLDRHEDETETARIKSRIFMNQGPGDVLILNQDEPLLAPLAERHPGEVWLFSRLGPVAEGAWLERGRIRLARDGRVRDLGSPPGTVDHPENLLAALLIALALGAGEEAVSGFINDPS